MNSDTAIARLIDHTILKPEATANEVRQVCREALQYGFASVCVNSGRVALVAQELEGSAVQVCTVVGFPLGAASPSTKVAETLGAVAEGATEVDMVLNIGALCEEDYTAAEADIRAVVAAASKHAIVKVILETCLLTNEQKITACKLAQAAGAAFVKTSTGFSKGGATVEDVALMRRAVGPEMGVKASGGVRTLEDLRAMVQAGATRIGSSSGVKIMQALQRPAAQNGGAAGAGQGLY